MQASAWASLAPLVVSLAGRFPIEGSRRAVHTFVHLGISVSLAALAATAVSFVALRPVLGLTRRLSASGLGLTVSQAEGGFHQDLLAYWMVLAAQHTLSYYRRYEDRRRHALQLEFEASQFRARVADARSSPHFASAFTRPSCSRRSRTPTRSSVSSATRTPKPCCRVSAISCGANLHIPTQC